jgi:hypothetical protein
VEKISAVLHVYKGHEAAMILLRDGVEVPAWRCRITDGPNYSLKLDVMYHDTILRTKYVSPDPEDDGTAIPQAAVDFLGEVYRDAPVSSEPRP